MAKNPKIEKLREEAMIPEAYITALFWNDPELYGVYSAEKINRETFLNKIWGFYFGLGRYMYDKKVEVFDDITVYRYIKEIKKEDLFEEYGEFETINEMMKEVKDKKENLDAYYEEVKKYKLLYGLANTIGDQVLDKDDKYDYHRLSREKIHTYWMDKILQIGMDGDSSFHEAFLLEGLEELVDDLDESPDTGLDFYDSKKMTEICAGQAKGCLYLNGGFGGKGKTSFSFNKVIMSHIYQKEKLVVIANEQDVRDFQKMLLITACGILKIKFQRKRLNEGGFTKEEREKLKEAINLVRDWTDGDDKLIVFVFLEHYTMEHVKKVLTYYHHRGFHSCMIDTGKPSDEMGGMQRWERFTEDMKILYKIIKPQALNMFCWVNVQLADSALNQRFLNEFAFGDSKKIKNEASVVFMGRHIWDDEFSGGKNALTVQYFAPKGSHKRGDPAFDDDIQDGVKRTNYERSWMDNFTVEEVEGQNYEIHKFELKQYDKFNKQNQFYLLFTSKNRRGQDNTTGLQVLVFKPNFNNNTWKEVGWTTVHKDYSF
ncbi:hypothetical protein QB910_000084 [Dabrowskivirus KKP3916]|uniref:Replicative DNA helicase n=1 Tax=Alicyclobacillus phage KKP_3916 TaxID=3040651 RepID=A0AAT9V7M9_9CAUD|nr:hypothetical protein QB910_000084 [Alicyclobacillus phage KKP 3916]